MQIYFPFIISYFIISFNTIKTAKNPSFEFIPTFTNQIIIKVGIGTPQQTFNLLLDTNLPYTWVLNSSSTQIANKTKYNSSKSKTFKPTNCLKYHFDEHKGKLKGKCASETITLPNGISFNDFNILIVDSFDENFKQINYNNIDGILGVAYKYEEISKGLNSFSIIDRFNSEKMLNEKLMNIKFRNEYIGSIEFGRISEEIVKLYYGTCAVVSDGEGEWKCELSRVEVGNLEKEKIEKLNNAGKLLFDTGVNYVVIPKNNKNIVIKNLFPMEFEKKYNCSWLNEGEYELLQCNNNVDIGEINDIYYFFDNYVIEYSPIDMFSLYGNYTRFNIYFSEDKWVVGQSLMKNFMMVFDSENQIIGFSSRNYLINLEIMTKNIFIFVLIVGVVMMIILNLGYFLFLYIKSKFGLKFKELQNFTSISDTDLKTNKTPDFYNTISNINLIPREYQDLSFSNTLTISKKNVFEPFEEDSDEEGNL